MKSFERRKGIALITVMMVVTMVSATASWLMLQQHVAMKRVTNVLHEEQAFLLALGAETYVRKLLSDDARNAGAKRLDYYARYDTELRSEWWSRQGAFDEDRMSVLFGFEGVRGARLTWCVFDLSALHNVNNFRFLATAKKGEGTRRAPSVREKSEAAQKNKKEAAAQTNTEKDEETRVLSQEQWERKMFDSLYGGSPDRWAALMDWFDKDEDARVGGGEDSYYLNLDSPYRVSGLRFVWPEELDMVKGFGGFKPSKEVIALPSVAPVKININTVSREMLARILGFMRISLDGEEWSALMEDRRNSPFRNLDSFYGRLVSYHDDRVTKKELSWANKFLDVASDYFLASIRIELGSVAFYLQSMFVREREDPYSVYVLQRRLGKTLYSRRDCRIDNPIVVSREEEDDVAY